MHLRSRINRMWWKAGSTFSPRSNFVYMLALHCFFAHCVKINLCQSVKIYAHDTPYANSWKTAGHFLDFTSLHAESVI